MNFAKEKRLLLAVLASLAPIPLPFNQVIFWAVLILFWAGIGLFVFRTNRDQLTPLPIWAMNLLGVAYLPILFVAVAWLWRGNLLRPLMHRALCALVVKMFGMRREKDKWHTLLLIFFVFVAAMGSSVHPSVMFYLAVFLAFTILVLARFASFHVLASYGREDAQSARLGLRRFMIAGTLATLIGAVPIFTVLPRLGSPYVVGPGGGTGSASGGAGLMDSITLDVIGRVRTSRAVALRMAYEVPPPEGHEMRFRAGVYSEFQRVGWHRSRRRTRVIRRDLDGFFHLAPGRAKSWVKIWLETAVSDSLVMPVETVAVDLLATTLYQDENGVTTFQVPRARKVDYRVGLFDEPGLRLPPVMSVQDLVAHTDQSGITPRIADLARQVAGEGTQLEKVQRIERFLSTSFDYTLDLVGNASEHPVESFLFEWQRGHCEYFASSMVLMLRSIEIPARLVTGYLGGEYNPFEDYYILRQSDGHAWIEAYLDGTSWQTFDPTPPDGRPAASRAGLGHLLGQAYDYLIFRWDRYVLTYGFFDQIGLVRKVVGWWSELWQSDKKQEAGAGESAAVTEADTPDTEGEDSRGLTGWELVPMTLLLLAGAWWVWRHRPEFSAVRAYRRLRTQAERDSAIDVSSTVAPLDLAARISKQRPAAASPAKQVIDLYLRESFGGEDLDELERRELQVALKEAVQTLRKTA